MNKDSSNRAPEEELSSQPPSRLKFRITKVSLLEKKGQTMIKITNSPPLPPPFGSSFFLTTSFLRHPRSTSGGFFKRKQRTTRKENGNLKQPLNQINHTTSAGKEGELRTTMPFAKHWSHETIVRIVQASQPERRNAQSVLDTSL